MEIFVKIIVPGKKTEYISVETDAQSVIKSIYHKWINSIDIPKEASIDSKTDNWIINHSHFESSSDITVLRKATTDEKKLLDSFLNILEFVSKSK